MLVRPHPADTAPHQQCSSIRGSQEHGAAAAACLQQQLALAERLQSTDAAQAPDDRRNKAKRKASALSPSPAPGSGEFNENQRSDSHLKAALRLGPKANSNNLTLLTPSLWDLRAAKVQINTLIKDRSGGSPGSRRQ